MAHFMTKDQEDLRRKALACEQVRLINPPTVRHKLTLLRNQYTGTKEFRELVAEISHNLVEAAINEDAQMSIMTIKTPIAGMESEIINENRYAFAPIIRAGEGMLTGVLEVMPNARVVHIGMFRDEETKRPTLYFFKAPPDVAAREVIIVDPMLATGGSANAAIDELEKRGVERIKLACIIAAPEGILAVAEKHQRVPIYTAAVDWYLNENAYIVPGLGDAGDRIFGTK